MSQASKAKLSAVEPVLAVRDVTVSCSFYARLGFRTRWRDERYAVLERDSVCLHLQWHDAKEWEAGIDRPMLRFVVDDVTALFEELRPSGGFHERTRVERTSWGTEEFAFYDLDRNGLVFYRDVE